VSASVNLRHLGRSEALAHLDLHVRLCRNRRVRFCRVIPGKGIDSKVEPVLKRAVIEWCRAPEHDAVLGWAPELDRHGEWGAMILELRGGLR
jgi:DNA-nicking Smr family endonuclease